MCMACKLPKMVALACSGGPDSMGALWFLNQKPGRVARIIFVDHGTEFSREGEVFVKDVASKLKKEIDIFHIEKPEKNAEAIWHNARNQIFQSYSLPVVTAHHLDDQVEQFLMTTIKSGEFSPIPSVNLNIFRPFLLTPRSKLLFFAERLGLGFLHDPSNADITKHRAYMRHILVPQICADLGVNLSTVVKKFPQRMMIRGTTT